MQNTAVQTWSIPASGVTRQCIRLLPSLTDVAFILPMIMLFGIYGGTRKLFMDGDTGWHIRTGEWILRHGTVPKTDLFSFTKPHQAWFAWEWGWDVAFACIHKSWGLEGVALASVALLCLVSVVVFRLCRRECGNDLLALTITIVVAFGSSIHWLARPHMAGWLLTAIFYSILVSTSEGATKQLCCLPVLMLLWTNIHGSFFVGVLLIATWCLGAVVEQVLQTPFSWSEVRRKASPYAVCALACGAATFVNPYGWNLHRHILEYLGDARQLDQIQEFQSISFHNGGAIFFEVMLLLGAASVSWCLKRRKIAAGITVLLWAHFALLSARNIPVFLLIAAPWVACMLQGAVGGVWRPQWLVRIREEVVSIYEEFRPFERIERWHLASGFALLIIALLLALHPRNFEARFNPDLFPEQAIPVLKAAHASRIFTYDQWDDFLIYRMQQKVLVDGRSDFYGADFIAQIQHVIAARYDWEPNLSAFRIDTVMLKPDAPLVTLLKRTPGWRVLFDDGRVVVLHAPTDFYRLSPVSRSGENDLGASGGSQVQSSSSRLITKERRS